MENFEEQEFKAGSHVFDAEKLAAGTCDMYPTISFTSEMSAVTKRNERERNRVRLVNEGFSCLRQKIPFAYGKKRLSKVETLRYAVDYIKHLQCVIQEHDKQFSGDVMEDQGREETFRLQKQNERVSSDVNERFSDNVIEKPGRKAMSRLMSTRAQERWKTLTDNGQNAAANAHVRSTLRQRIRKNTRGEGQGSFLGR